MRRRIESSETGWVFAKALVLFVVLGTLSGFTVLSHLVSQARAGRIDCIDNQRATYQALLHYQSDHDGRSPRSLELLKSECLDCTAIPGRCPVDDNVRYYIDPASGRVMCPNPAHRPGP